MRDGRWRHEIPQDAMRDSMTSPPILCAPTEPKEVISLLGHSSSIPENYGADYFWVGKGPKKVGVQRKEVKDFVASVQDGRLGKEVIQMGDLDIAALVIEGKLRWTRDGELVDGWVKLTKPQLRGALWTVHSKGIWIEWADEKTDTVDSIRSLHTWVEKDTHSSLMVKQGPKRDGWGQRDNKDWQIHILSSFPGIGAGLAERVIDHFGSLPLALTVGEGELKQVNGVGEQTAKKIMEALHG